MFIRAVRGQKWGFPLTLTVALTTGQHYRANVIVIRFCDEMILIELIFTVRPFMQCNAWYSHKKPVCPSVRLSDRPSVRLSNACIVTK